MCHRHWSVAIKDNDQLFDWRARASLPSGTNSTIFYTTIHRPTMHAFGLCPSFPPKWCWMILDAWWEPLSTRRHSLRYSMPDRGCTSFKYYLWFQDASQVVNRPGWLAQIQLLCARSCLPKKLCICLLVSEFYPYEPNRLHHPWATQEQLIKKSKLTVVLPLQWSGPASVGFGRLKGPKPVTHPMICWGAPLLPGALGKPQ